MTVYLMFHFFFRFVFFLAATDIFPLQICSKNIGALYYEMFLQVLRARSLYELLKKKIYSKYIDGMQYIS